MESWKVTLPQIGSTRCLQAVIFQPLTAPANHPTSPKLFAKRHFRQPLMDEMWHWWQLTVIIWQPLSEFCTILPPWTKASAISLHQSESSLRALKKNHWFLLQMSKFKRKIVSRKSFCCHGDKTKCREFSLGVGQGLFFRDAGATFDPPLGRRIPVSFVD